MNDDRPIDFRGDSLDVIKSFPEPARQRMGYQLNLLQLGQTPDDFKRMRSVGPGAYEIRVAVEGQAFRSFYVANRGETIYVLHAFEKKSHKTKQSDIDKGRARLKDLDRELKASPP